MAILAVPKGLRTDRVSVSLRLLVAATVIGSPGLGAGGAAGPLLAVEIQGSEAVAGLPLGVLIGGAAVGAIAISRRTSVQGRGSGLSLGYAVGSVGAGIVVGGAVLNSLAVVLAGTFLLGGASAAFFLSRYAAAELAGAGARGRGVGTILWAATVGAVVSPNLLAPTGRLAALLGLPRLAGLFLVAGPAFLVAAAITGVSLRRSAPDLGRLKPAQGRGLRMLEVLIQSLRSSPSRLALIILATSNLVMVGIMAVAPVQMMEHGHHLGAVGFIVSIHIAGMFAPSVLTGWLADRFDAVPVALGGTLLLVVSGVFGALVNLEGSLAVTVFLLLVGIAWNGGVVGGSAMLAASVEGSARAQAEGIGEVAMSTAAAVAAPGAGPVVAAGGFGALALVGASAAATTALIVGLAIRSSVSTPNPLRGEASDGDSSSFSRRRESESAEPWREDSTKEGVHG
jgi:MFS family permease